ncbi:MAG: Ig-like domain-containing protein [Gammaproteobacteria bacterium]|nr:Ig-like domain-containing protein [Gammaproteobacteria bacterium]
MMRTHRIIAWRELATALLTSLGLMTLTACGGGGGGSPPPPSLTTISVTPAAPSVALGGTQQFTATGRYSDGSTQNLTTTATWSSSDRSVATIASGGLATSVGTGTTTISAASGSVTGNTI